MPLDVAIGRVFVPYLVDAMVINFGVKNQVVALWKSLFKASIKMAPNGPYTQLIEATSCVERSNATMKAE